MLLKMGCGINTAWKPSSAGAPASSSLPRPLWLRGLALSYEELSGKRGWMAEGLIKSIDLLLPAPALAAGKAVMDGACPGAPHGAGAAITPALGGVDKGEGAGSRQHPWGQEG